MTAKRAYKQFHIGFSKEEWEIVCRKAKAARLRNGTYVRRMAVKGEIKYYELKELVTLKRAFLSIGNNLNQIAKVANESGSVYQKDIEDLQEEFKYFRTAIVEICYLKKAKGDFIQLDLLKNYLPEDKEELCDYMFEI